MACGLFFGEQRPVVAERIDVEELEGSPDWVESSLGYSQVIADVEDVVLDLPLAELIGRNHVVTGQLASSSHILTLRPFDQPGEPHVPNHALSEFSHCDTLSCMRAKELRPQRPETQGYQPEPSEGRLPPHRRTDSEGCPIPRRSRFVQAKIRRKLPESQGLEQCLRKAQCPGRWLRR